MVESGASPRTFLGKLRRGWHRRFGKTGMWEGGENRGWDQRLFVLLPMWLPASPRDREGAPQGSVKTEAVWLESWPHEWLRVRKDQIPGAECSQPRLPW